MRGMSARAIARRSRGFRGSYTPASSQPPLLFASDFSQGGTGTGTTALRDGTRWNATIGGPTGMSIVGGHGLAFPTENVLRIVSPYPGTSGYHRLFVDTLPALADNAGRYFRAYVRVMMAASDVSDTSTHPIESGQDSDGLDWSMNIELVSDTEYYMLLQAPGEANGGLFWRQRWRCPNLTVGEVYRFDWQVIQRPNTTVTPAPTSRKTMQFHARVAHCTLSGATVTETDLYADADFTNRDGSNGVSAGSVSLEAGTTLLMSTTDGRHLSTLRAGNNGITGVYPNNLHIGDQGGIAVSDDDWIGPYVPGETP